LPSAEAARDALSSVEDPEDEMSMVERAAVGLAGGVGGRPRTLLSKEKK
jgi:hypothetical protein